MSKSGSIFDDNKYDEYCCKPPNLPDGLFSDYDYGLSDDTKEADRYNVITIKSSNIESLRTREFHRIAVELGIQPEASDANISRVFVVHKDGILAKARAALADLIHSEVETLDERYEKGQEKKSTFYVSRDAASLVADYILSERKVYSKEVFSTQSSDNGEEALTSFDKTPLVEDLRRFIGDTILKSLVLIARRERGNKEKNIMITQLSHVQEHYLYDEIGERVTSKYRPRYSKITNFNNLICNDIKKFVRDYDFSGEWGELIYDKKEDAVYLKTTVSKNIETKDAPLTERVGAEGLS